MGMGAYDEENIFRVESQDVRNNVDTRCRLPVAA